MQFLSLISTVHFHIYCCGKTVKYFQTYRDCIWSAICSHYLIKFVFVLSVPMYVRSLYLHSTLESTAVLNVKKESVYFDPLCALLVLHCCISIYYTALYIIQIIIQIIQQWLVDTWQHFQ